MDRYERLRAGALEACPAVGLGWTLFRRRGMWAWCHAVQEQDWPAAARRRGAGRRVSSTPNAELVHVLVDMMLAAHPEVTQ